MEGTASVRRRSARQLRGRRRAGGRGRRRAGREQAPAPGRRRISVDDGVKVELHLELARGAAAQEVGAEVQRRVGRLPRADGGAAARARRRRDRRDRMSRVRIAESDRLRRSRAHADRVPRVHVVAVAHRRPRARQAPLDREAETEFGAWGTLYYDDDGRTLGSMQYGPAQLFPRAAELPAGRLRTTPCIVTCAYLVDRSSPWVLQSLFLAAIGEAKDKGAAALGDLRVPLPRGRSPTTSASSSTGRSSRTTSWPTSASGRSAPPAPSSWRGWSSAASMPVARRQARRVLRALKDALLPEAGARAAAA